MQNGTQGIYGQPVVSVIIPTRNEEKWIASCLESVLNVDSCQCKEVIVVDDASTDSTYEIIRRLPVEVIRNKKPVGPSSARNIGAKKAKGEIIVFVDAHCIVDDVEWIQKFLGLFRDPEVGAVGGYFRPKPSKWRLSLTLRPDKNRLRLIKSANSAYRKAVFELVGGFDSAVEWGGDAALTFKVYRSGWKVVHSRDITVVHAEKVWSIRRTFFYGTCYFPLRKRYPGYKAVSGLLLPPMVIGLIVTLGVLVDGLLKIPFFTLLSVILVSLLNGAAAHTPIRRILTDGLYTTIWSFSY